MLRWFDGLEQYGDVARMTEGVGGGAAWSQVDQVAAVYGGWALSTASPATGTYHMRLTDGRPTAKLIRRVWGQAKEVVGLGYRFSVDDLPVSEGTTGENPALVLAQVRDVTNNTHFTLILGTDGSIVAKTGFTMTPGLGTNGTVIGRSDPCVARGGKHHLELKTKIHNSTGYIEVRINEVTVLNLTGIDTQHTVEAAAAQFVIGKTDAVVTLASCGYGFADFDDFVAWDDDASDPENTIVDFVGDKGVYYLPPVGDTATADFAKVGSATSYGAIDEVPPSGTDYLSTASSSARTILNVQALPANVAEVIAFMPVIHARKEESGTVLLRGGLISGTDETYGPEDNPATEYNYLRPGPKTIDPATGVPWANDAAPKLLIERTA